LPRAVLEVDTVAAVDIDMLCPTPPTEDTELPICICVALSAGPAVAVAVAGTDRVNGPSVDTLKSREASVGLEIVTAL
jgi:hypothetical protein